MTPMEAFSLLSPAAYQAVSPWFGQPLADYLGHLWDTAGTGTAWIAATERVGESTIGRALLFDQLAENMTEQGFSQSMVDAVWRQLERVPVVQTADHTQLVLDPVMFANHVATLIGAQRGGCEYVVVLGSSVNSFTSRAGHGPGLLSTGSEVLNVFGLNARARSGSVYAHREPVRFEFTPLGSNDISPTGAWLRRLVGTDEHSSAAEAFHRGNQALWRQFGFRGLVQMDNTFSARLTARHIRLGRGVVYELFFNQEARAEVLAARRDIGSDPILGGFLRHQTDLLWGAAKGRLRPLSLDADALRDDKGHIAIPFEPDSIASALDAGVLVPDVCVTYLVTNILPDLCTLGGPSQLVYVPLMWELFRPLGVGLGATALVQGVLEVDRPIDLLRRSAADNADWVAQTGARTVAESMGEMRAFDYLVGMAEHS